MPFDKSLALNAAKAYMLESNYAAAIQIYLKIIEADPEDFASINTLGDLYARANRVPDAVSEFSRLADNYLQGGFSRKAIAVLKKVMAIDPKNTATWIKLADVYAKAGLATEARQHYLQIAEAYSRSGQNGEALTAYRKVVDLDPANASTRIKLGELYLRERMAEEAYSAFITAAGQLASRGERRRAINAYTEALAIRPDSKEAMLALSKLTEGPDNLATKPALTAALGTSMAEAAASSGNLNPVSAAAPPTPAEERNSALVVHEISKAEILVAYGKADQAIAMLREVANKLPDNPDVRIKLKDIYLRIGMTSEGAAECHELERIYRIQGDDSRAKDYAVRASRLTQLMEQPSGDLAETKSQPSKQPESPVAAVSSVALPKVPTTVSAPAALTSPKSEPAHAAPAQIPVAKTEISPLPSAPTPARPEVVQVQTGPNVASSRPASIPVARPETAPTQSASVLLPRPVATPAERRPVAVADARPAAPVKVLPTQVMVPEVIEPELVAAAVVEVPAPTDLVLRSPIQQSDLSSLVKAEKTAPMTGKRSKFKMAAIAAGIVAMLGGGAVVGGFFFNSRLNKQYETLSMVTPPPPAPATNEASAAPPATSGEAEQAPTEQMTVVATPAKEKQEPPTRNTAPETKQNQREETSHPMPVAERPREVAPPPASAPAPPQASATPDSRAIGDPHTPAGLPTGVPSASAGNAPTPVEQVQKPQPRVSQGVVLGGAVKKVEPGYPQSARDARLSGSVRVEVSIDEKGNVIGAHAISGPAMLHSAAVNAARSWKFKPSTMGGTPVKTSTVIVFNFKL